MNLEHEFSYVADLKEPLQIGPGPFGNRNFYEVTGGTVEGKRLKGKLLTGGGDWLLVGPDGFGRLDVRAQILTDDGAVIYVYYTGIVQMNEKVAQATAAGRSTDYGDQYFRTAPRLESGDPRYAWVNQSIFVAEGRVGPHRVEYKVYRVV
ncbi:MAG TPA: DUF3237 domain-containing protein [Candidatus Binataceae bacterium]|nr:DUF3237 domain-containing protein [Candidatus Binataceae bacterium]